MIASRLLALAAGVAVIALAERPCPAMSRAALVAAEWDCVVTSRLIIKDFMNKLTHAPGTAAFSDDKTFVVTENDDDGDLLYSGTFTLANRGRAIRATLDSKGKAQARKAVMGSIRAFAEDEGIALSNLRVTLSSVQLKQAALPATVAPGTVFTIKHVISGSASARINGRNRSGPLTNNGHTKFTAQ